MDRTDSTKIAGKKKQKSEKAKYKNTRRHSSTISQLFHWRRDRTWLKCCYVGEWNMKCHCFIPPPHANVCLGILFQEGAERRTFNRMIFILAYNFLFTQKYCWVNTLSWADVYWMGVANGNNNGIWEWVNNNGIWEWVPQDGGWGYSAHDEV